MDGRFEDDNEDIAPLPPHERAWRHPAEVSDESRRRHALESAPPPVGRRVTTLVAFVSVVASAVIAMVTVPKGIDSGQEETSAATASVPAKGATGAGTPKRRPSPAIAIASGVVVAESSVMSDSAQVTLTDGTTVSGTPVAPPDEHGLVLLRTDADVNPLVNDLSDDEFRYLGDGGRLSLVFADGTRETTRLGLSTRDPGRWWPLSIDTSVDATIARIVDSDGALVGIAVRENHAMWAVKLGDLLARVNDAGAAQGG